VPHSGTVCRQYNFVTNLTSLVVTKDNLGKENFAVDSGNLDQNSAFDTEPKIVVKTSRKYGNVKFLTFKTNKNNF
jgi:hypothetical protein